MEEAQAEERRVRLAQMRQEEEAQEMQAGATIEFSMNLFRFFWFCWIMLVVLDDFSLSSSAFAPANVKAKDHGDRLVFPPSVLRFFMRILRVFF